jgi:aconitate hydratase
MGIWADDGRGSRSHAHCTRPGGLPAAVVGIRGDLKPRQNATLVIHRRNGSTDKVPVKVRIDTPIEVDYYEFGGILPYVLRQLTL